MFRRRLFAIITALAATLALVAPAFADTRVIVYPSQNPSSTEQNVNARFARHTTGDLARDLMGATISAAGTYGNFTVAPAVGLFVTVGPTTVGTDGTLYQLGQVDPNALPTGGYTPNLAADTTKTIISAQSNVTSAGIGPLTAPGAGLSVYYLIEAQESTADGNPQSLLFVTQNPNGSATQSFATVPTNRVDVISYQSKAGTPASSSPAQPVVDSGWVAIGYVLVTNGQSQIITGNITAAPGLAGFAPNSAVVHVSPLASPSPDAGNSAVTGQSAANQLVSTATTGTAPLVVNSTTTVPNLTAQYATAISPAPTPTAAAPLIQNGTWPNLTYSCPSCVSSATTPLQDVGGVISIATPIPQSLGGTGTGTVTGLASGNSIGSVSGSFPNQTFTVAASPTFTALTTGALNATGAVTFSSLLSGCLQTNGSGVLSITTCGGGSGVSSVTGSAPIVSSGGSTPAISCATCVVLTPGSQQLGSINASSTIEGDGGFVTTSTSAMTFNPGALVPSFTSNGTANNGFVFNAVSSSTNIAIFRSNGTNEFALSNAGTGTFTGGVAATSGSFSSSSPLAFSSTSGNTITSASTGSAVPFFFNASGSSTGNLAQFAESGTPKVTISNIGSIGLPSGFLNVGNAAASTAGDIGLGRSATTAIIFMGTSPTIDYGITTASAFTLSGGPVNVKSNGLEVGPTINSVNTLGYVPPVYTAAGAATASTMHGVIGTCIFTGTSSCSVALTNAAVFSGTGDYSCFAEYPSASSVWFIPDITSGSAFTLSSWETSGLFAFTGTANYACIGF